VSRKRSDQFARRSSGVLLHPTSLPGPHGCGDLGRWARRFVDFLHASRQSWWQTLPIGPVGSDGCPYHSPSTFAGSELLISLESLQRDGLLRRREIRPMPTSRRRQVDFAATRRYRTQRLRLAYDRFRQFGGDESEALHAFRRRERYWLDDYAMFVALHDRSRGAWVKWPRELRLRHRRSLRRAEQELAYQVCERRGKSAARGAVKV